jgi:hypothetical protein
MILLDRKATSVPWACLRDLHPTHGIRGVIVVDAAMRRRDIREKSARHAKNSA